jgi:hypothetical protein
VKTAFCSRSRRQALAVLLVLGFLNHSQAADVPPSVTLKHAVELAEQTLVEKGVADQVYVVSAVLKRETLTAAKSFWEIAWSSAITGSKPGSQEVGVQVTMNGDVIHLLKGRGEFHRVPPPR